MDNCHCHTEVTRDGSSQLNRYLKALDPSYAPVDGRSLEDLLVFAKKYAAQIRFYDIPESMSGNEKDAPKISWREFFRRDMAVIAASLSVVDLQEFRKEYDEVRERLEYAPTSELFAALFNPMLGMAAQMDRWYTLAIPENPLHVDLDLAIRSSLHEQMRKIIAYEEGFKYIDHKKTLKLDYSAIENVELWGVNDTVDADATIYEGADEAEQLRHAALFVDDIFSSFHASISRIVGKSDDYLRYALEQYPAHQPHMALFITFLQLYRLAQDQMNTLTESILNFYYRDVLHLVEKPSVPDRVYIILELARNIAEYDLVAGTAMNGGKDALGKEQLYITKNDFVVNQAKVKELKNIFIEKAVATIPDSHQVAIQVIQAVFARPVANSLDGFGEKISDPSGKWPTFGKTGQAIFSAKNPCDMIAIGKPETNRKDQAKVGFAIASPQLLLQGGKRLLTLKIERLNALLATSAGGAKAPFEIVLTGEKGWLKVTRVMTDSEYQDLIKDLAHGIIHPDSSLGTSYYITDKNEIVVYLPIAEQPIIRFNEKMHPGYDFETEHPVMQVLLNEHLHLYHRAYNIVTMSALSLDVRVGSINLSDENEKHFDGLKQLVIQTENGLFPSDKPFDPFTAYPLIGKSFYIGSQEVFNKPLKELGINILRTVEAGTEKNIDDGIIPGAFVAHGDVAMGVFGAAGLPSDYKVFVLKQKGFIPLSTNKGDKQFYVDQLSNDILFTPNAAGGGASKLSLDRKPLRNVTEWKAGTEKGFVRIDTLKGGTVGGNSSFLQSAPDIAALVQIKEISVSYHSELTRLEAGIDQFFHVYPFGVVETYIDEAHIKEQTKKEEIRVTGALKKLDRKRGNLLVDAKNLLFPQFTYEGLYSSFQAGQEVEKILLDNKGNTSQKPAKVPAFDYSNVIHYSATIDSAPGVNQYSGHIQEEGQLYIGLENLEPLQSVSLLFQFAEGSATDEDHDPPVIHWSYLSNNEWKPLRGEHLVSDGTYGFQTTGIVKIDVPADATDRNTIITDGLLWFAASVTEHSERIPQLIGVVAQAVEAVFEDRANAQSHFDKPLPASSISKLAVAVNEISKVTQPYATFDGKHREVGKEFYTRVSERLRHKRRAVTAWDYEHLVLDRFPSIYKVKCITHTDPNCLCRHTELAELVEGKITRENNGTRVGSASGGHTPKAVCCGPQSAPGHVFVIPIANLKNRNAVNPLQPKTSRRTLLEIEAYLKKYTSTFVHVHVGNPKYEQIIVAFRVQFYSGTDKGYFLKKLNDEIVHYLTPWAFDDQAEVKFGQKVYASSIIQFIEQRPYVDFITDFFMGVCRDECCPEHAEHKHKTDQHDEPANDIEQVHNCNELQILMQQKNRFIGETIAVPSGPRSILVSVPQHVIIPFEEPEHLSPCERRKMIKETIPQEIAPVPVPPAPQPQPLVDKKKIIEKEKKVPVAKSTEDEKDTIVKAEEKPVGKARVPKKTGKKTDK